MKTGKLLIITGLALSLFSCSKNNGKSDAYGNFEATEVTISSEGNGKILRFNIEEGIEVKTGDTIGFIDTTELNLSKEQLLVNRNIIRSKADGVLSQIEIYKQQKANLQVDKNRIEKLLKDKAATQKQFDDISGAIEVIDKQINSVKTQNASILNELEALEKQVAQVNEKIRKCYIISPIEGTVISKYAEANEIATMGKPLYKIADMKNMILRAYIDGGQLGDIKTGQKVKVLIDKGEKEFKEYEGILSWVSSSAEFTPKIIQTKKERVNMVYAIKVFVKNDGSLKIGMPGEVRID